MISFYPGPSKLFPEVSQYLQEAFDSGILSVNHRSSEFIEVSKTAVSLLKEKFEIPESYSVFFVSSATECWEIIAQSFASLNFWHFYNGAFGEKWFEYNNRLNNLEFSPKSNFQKVNGSKFSCQEEIPSNSILTAMDVLCLTHNETSNGTHISSEKLTELKNIYNNSIIAVDATSSLGGIFIDFSLADIWFASVQKCLGLPAGMAVLVCSPNAVKKALELNHRKHYNDLAFIFEKMKDWQTTHTPNVLNVFLLKKVLEKSSTIRSIHEQSLERAKDYYSYFTTLGLLKPLIENEKVRSNTVVAVEGGASIIDQLKKEAKQSGILLGNGYGEWAKTTFRIANFPAIQEKEITVLKEFLQKFVNQRK